MVEWDRDACQSVRHNANRGISPFDRWPLREADVRSIDWSKIEGDVDLVAGGPPCQPFSIGGKHAGHEDERDMWPEAIRAVRELRPKAFLFENVRGLLRPAFADYLRWITLHLTNPNLKRRAGETHAEHVVRLERTRSSADYDVKVVPVNAADYGAPQKRNRVVIIGIRRNLEVELIDPKPTHSLDRLLWDQWITGEYWHRHGLRQPALRGLDAKVRRQVERLKAQMIPPREKAWMTVRDALLGLGEPALTRGFGNHAFQPGARVYVGHTGSPLDEPSKALKAGDHGVPGGENMMVLPRGGVRYFTIREAARLQGLPDGFEFPISWSESMRQLGNAVPVQLAQTAGKWVTGMLARAHAAARRAA
jgi:DNA (cytosine-5)-methyltransferase 1